MITEFLLDIGFWFAALIPGWFPALDLPEVNSTEGIGSFLASLHGTGVWVNWGALITMLGVNVAWWTGFGLFKLARAAAAHFPAFGGAG